MTESLKIEPGVRVAIELLSKNKTREKLAFVLVPQDQADFDNGLLGINTPLAQVLLGHAAGETLDYARGDIAQVRILSVQPADANAQAHDTSEQRDETLRRARDKAELSSMVSFALTFDSKWGDYDPEQIVKQYEAEEHEKNQPPPDDKKDA